MWNLIKKYWDILGGFITGVLISVIARFELERIQLAYSIIILILVSMGVFKIIRQTIFSGKEKRKNKRKQNIIDGAVESQKPVKAINLAQEPTKEGEKLGRLFIDTFKGGKKIMAKIKKFIDKFKGYMLTLALFILGLVEYCGGFINDIMGDKLEVHGINIISIITLTCAIIIGCISNGFDKEQKEKIKALFSKSSTNELVQAEIKKSIKENTTKLAQFNKILDTKETELENLENDLDRAKNTYAAKQEMYNMVPQLATAEDVQLANESVNLIKVKIDTKNVEITETKNTISNLTTTINALKSQL